jgi:hypothetical protein
MYQQVLAELFDLMLYEDSHHIKDEDGLVHLMRVLVMLFKEQIKLLLMQQIFWLFMQPLKKVNSYTSKVDSEFLKDYSV